MSYSRYDILGKKLNYLKQIYNLAFDDMPLDMLEKYSFKNPFNNTEGFNLITMHVLAHREICRQKFLCNTISLCDKRFNDDAIILHKRLSACESIYQDILSSELDVNTIRESAENIGYYSNTPRPHVIKVNDNNSITFEYINE